MISWDLRIIYSLYQEILELKLVDSALKTDLQKLLQTLQDAAILEEILSNNSRKQPLCTHIDKKMERPKSQDEIIFELTDLLNNVDFLIDIHGNDRKIKKFLETIQKISRDLLSSINEMDRNEILAILRMKLLKSDERSILGSLTEQEFQKIQKTFGTPINFHKYLNIHLTGYMLVLIFDPHFLVLDINAIDLDTGKKIAYYHNYVNSRLKINEKLLETASELFKGKLPLVDCEIAVCGGKGEEHLLGLRELDCSGNDYSRQGVAKNLILAGFKELKKLGKIKHLIRTKHSFLAKIFEQQGYKVLPRFADQQNEYILLKIIT